MDERLSRHGSNVEALTVSAVKAAELQSGSRACRIARSVGFDRATVLGTLGRVTRGLKSAMRKRAVVAISRGLIIPGRRLTGRCA